MTTELLIPHATAQVVGFRVADRFRQSQDGVGNLSNSNKTREAWFLVLT